MKKTAPVDFAEAERKAAEEAERIKQLGYDRQREEEEEKARKEAEKLKKATEIGPVSKISNQSSATSLKPPVFQPSGNPADLERLGMASRKLAFGAVPAAGAAGASSAARSSSPQVESSDAPTSARERFGNQKAISSDMYFGRNTYDPDVVSESRTRLQAFQGATAISSNAYFGREEDEDVGGGTGSESLLGDGSLAGLEVAARDAVSKVLSNPDVQNVGESIRAGALKLSDYLAQISMDR